MPAIIETTNNISKITDNLIDFLVKDEKLSKEFEDFLKINNIQIERESELTDIIIDYILDGRMQDNTRVLDYYLKNNPDADKKTLTSLRNSFISIFQIKKVLKNAYETNCLISEKDFTLIPLVKTTSLRGIAFGDFIKARVIEEDNNFYILEIHDVISSLKEWEANRQAVLCMIKAPNTASVHNKEKFLEIKKSTESFNSSFQEYFNKDEIILENKDTDAFLNEFYLYHTGKINKISDFKTINEENLKYFEIKEFKNDVIQNAYMGFNSTEETFDTGIYTDSEFGLFVIPFLGCVNKILKENNLNAVENGKECLLNFLNSFKTPVNLIKKKGEEFPNLIELTNTAAEKNFAAIEDIIEFFRPDYFEIKAGANFSPVMVLYNSKAFSKILNKKEEKKEIEVGRNDLCPCGSGKKYKKCCLLKKDN